MGYLGMTGSANLLVVSKEYGNMLYSDIPVFRTNHQRDIRHTRLQTSRKAPQVIFRI